MKDKELIRKEIERWMGLCPECGHVLGKLCDFIDSMPQDVDSINVRETATFPDDTFKELISKLQEPVSVGLEEAAIEYWIQTVRKGDNSKLESFRAGAQWQKQQMMKNSVDAQYRNIFGETLLAYTPYELGIRGHDKVKILVIKEN